MKQVKPLTPNQIEIYDLICNQNMTHQQAAVKKNISREAITQAWSVIKKKLNIIPQNTTNGAEIKVCKLTN